MDAKTLTAQWQPTPGRFVITCTDDGNSVGNSQAEPAACLAFEHLAGQSDPTEAQVAHVVAQLEKMKDGGRGGVLSLNPGEEDPASPPADSPDGGASADAEPAGEPDVEPAGEGIPSDGEPEDEDEPEA